MNLRITTYDSVGHASVTFQRTECFTGLVEAIIDRISPEGKIKKQTESSIKYTIGSWTKEIEVV